MLAQVRCADPLSLWVDEGTPLLANETGSVVAVGLLIDRAARRRLADLPAWQSPEQTFLRDFWGCYVLFSAAGDSHSVLRDPSGPVPVYHCTSGDLQLYASDSGMLALARTEPSRPDLDAVRHWLRFPFLRTARTGALNVTELLPGCLREVRAGQESVRPAWLPQRFAGRALAIASFAEAQTLLRETILQSVGLLAAGQSRIVLQLSGGLDSSILAAALSHAGIRYRAMTFATLAPAGDERRYARQVASHFGVQLHELTESDVDLSVRTASGPLQRPPSPFLQGLRQAQLAATGPDALLLDGGGGDNLFASINSASPAIDAMRTHGPAESVRTVRNLAARHGCTVWVAAASALRRAARGTIRWPADDSFLAPGAYPPVPDPHPWLADLGDLLPGSADHLRMIAGIHHFFLDPALGQPANLHPLVCQPLIEACLQIRSWLWFEGGRDRAVARAAFRTLLPDVIIDRRGKGSLQGMFVTGFRRQRAELRDTLVNGRLAEAGVIDSKAIGSYLDRDQEPLDAGYVRILEIASAEQWLRSFG
jgi:asparagine synthase (glutamine-hydrolysing)